MTSRPAGNTHGQDEERRATRRTQNEEMRDIEVEFDFTPNALASILYKQGNTMVLATVTADEGLPRWFPRNATRGWIHAEYSLLPGSTNTRFRRERNGAKGRTHEIERGLWPDRSEAPLIWNNQGPSR